MALNLSALKVELLTGSFAATLYSANVTRRDYNALADTINTVGLTQSTIQIGTIGALELQQCVVVTEYLTLTNQQRDLWNAIVTTATQGLAISNTLIRAQITGIWSAGLSATRSNLISAQTRLCSRGETLFGEGVVVDTNAIHVALTQ